MSTIQKEYGAVAILDALGASTYGDIEIQRFLNAREQVLALLNEQAEENSDSIERSELTTFTFNDTIIIVLRAGQSVPNLQKVTTFAALLRKFVVDSMAHGLLFRGAAALGTFYVDEETNTVMGEAVTDAAQWYDKSDWVGVHLTPRSFMELQRMMEIKNDAKRWAFLPYAVPLRNGSGLQTYAINWPKIFLVKHLRPWKDDLPERSKLMKFLSLHKVPLGTEIKYFNTVAFFDHSLKEEAKRKPKKK